MSQGSRFTRCLWWLGTVLMIVVRVFLLAVLWREDNVVSLIVFFVELIALTLGVMNLIVSKDRDYSFGGLYVSAAYASGVALFPRGLEIHWISAFGSLLGIALSTWALLYLGWRFTVGGTSWVSLCDRGPYRYIRHPQLAARLLILASLLPSLQTEIQHLHVAAAFLITVTVIEIEEMALRRKSEYRAYVRRVPYTILPRVF